MLKKPRNFPKHWTRVKCISLYGNSQFRLGEYYSLPFHDTILLEEARTSNVLFEMVECEEVDKPEPVQEDVQLADLQEGNPKYDKRIIGKYGSGSCIVDVYSILHSFEVVNPCLQHLVKKALACGKRGHKDSRQDLLDIVHSATRALEMYNDEKKSNNI